MVEKSPFDGVLDSILMPVNWPPLAEGLGGQAGGRTSASRSEGRLIVMRGGYIAAGRAGMPGCMRKKQIRVRALWVAAVQHKMMSQCALPRWKTIKKPHRLRFAADQCFCWRNGCTHRAARLKMDGCSLRLHQLWCGASVSSLTFACRAELCSRSRSSACTRPWGSVVVERAAGVEPDVRATRRPRSNGRGAGKQARKQTRQGAHSMAGFRARCGHAAGRNNATGRNGQATCKQQKALACSRSCSCPLLLLTRRRSERVSSPLVDAASAGKQVSCTAIATACELLCVDEQATAWAADRRELMYCRGCGCRMCLWRREQRVRRIPTTTGLDLYLTPGTWAPASASEVNTRLPGGWL